MTRRRAFTLVEMIATVTITTLILMTVAATIISLSKINRRLSADASAAIAFNRLGLTLRSDAHAAVGAKRDGNLVRLMMSDERQIVFEWDLKRRQITRSILRDGATLHLDRFALPKTSEATLSVEGEPPAFLTLVVHEHAGLVPRATDDVRETTIVAAIGLEGK